MGGAPNRLEALSSWRRNRHRHGQTGGEALYSEEGIAKSGRTAHSGCDRPRQRRSYGALPGRASPLTHVFRIVGSTKTRTVFSRTQCPAGSAKNVASEHRYTEATWCCCVIVALLGRFRTPCSLSTNVQQLIQCRVEAISRFQCPHSCRGCIALVACLCVLPRPVHPPAEPGQ